MGLIIVTVLAIAVFVVGGYYLVKRWKKEELEKRKKRSRLAIVNKTTSMEELIRKIDETPVKRQPDAVDPAAAQVKVKKELFTTDEVAERVKRLREAALAAQAADEVVQKVKNAFVTDENNLKPAVARLTVKAFDPETGKVEDFRRAVENILGRQEEVVKLQKQLQLNNQEFGPKLQLLVAALKTLSAEVVRNEGYKLKDLPADLTAVLVLAKRIQKDLEGKVKEHYSTASEMRKKTRRLKLYQPPQAAHAKRFQTLESKLEGLIVEVTAAWLVIRDAYAGWLRATATRDSATQAANATIVPGNTTVDGFDAYMQRCISTLRTMYMAEEAVDAACAPSIAAADAANLPLQALEQFLIGQKGVTGHSARLAACITVADQWKGFVTTAKTTTRTAAVGHVPKKARVTETAADRQAVIDEIRVRFREAYAEEHPVSEALKLAVAAHYETDKLITQLAALVPDRVSDPSRVSGLTKPVEFFAEVRLVAGREGDARLVAIEKRAAMKVLVDRMAKALEPVKGLMSKLPRPAEGEPRLALEEDASIRALERAQVYVGERLGHWQSQLNKLKQYGVPPQGERLLEIDVQIGLLCERIPVETARRATLGTAEGEVAKAVAVCDAVMKESIGKPPVKPTDADVGPYLEGMRKWAVKARQSQCTAWEQRERMRVQVEGLETNMLAINQLLTELLTLSPKTAHFVDESMLRAAKWLVQQSNDGVQVYRKKLEAFVCVDPTVDETLEDEARLLEELTAAQRALGFAVAQAGVSKEKFEKQKALKAPDAPAVPPLTALLEQFDVEALLGQTEVYLTGVDRTTAEAASLKTATDTAKQGVERRQATVKGKSTALTQLVEGMFAEKPGKPTEALYLERLGARKLCTVHAAA